MIKAIIVYSDKPVFDFLQKAEQKGLKIIMASAELGLNLDEVFRKAAYSVDFHANECLVLTSELEGHKAARKASMIACGFGSHSEIEQIQAGCDIVLRDINEFPDYEDADSFTAVVDSLIRDFYSNTIIGKLLSKAEEVKKNAYAPYSKFKVGAAIYTENSNIYTGCNVENASFGGTICAERGAAMTAIASEGKTSFKLIAIASDAEEPAPPCAICRQFLSEFVDEDTQVYLVSSKSKTLRHHDFATLMPYSFTEF